MQYKKSWETTNECQKRTDRPPEDTGRWGSFRRTPRAWARPPALAGVRAQSQDVLSPAGVSFRPVTGSWRMKGATTPPQESTDLMFQVRQSYLSPARGLPRFSSVLSSRRVRNSGCGGPSRRGTFFRSSGVGLLSLGGAHRAQGASTSGSGPGGQRGYRPGLF